MIVEQYQKLALRVDALQLRERLMVLVVSIVFLVFLADSLGFQPVFKQQQLLMQNIKEHELQLDLLRAQSSQLYENSALTKPAPVAELEQRLSGFGSKLQSRLDSMLSPDQATGILEQVITSEQGLVLNAVNATQTPLISLDDEAGGKGSIGDINSYEYELKLEGGYLETLSYLRALEALPWKFFWTGISFVVTEYPNASVDLELYTLGQARN